MPLVQLNPKRLEAGDCRYGTGFSFECPGLHLNCRVTVRFKWPDDGGPPDGWPNLHHDGGGFDDFSVMPFEHGQGVLLVIYQGEVSVVLRD